MVRISVLNDTLKVILALQPTSLRRGCVEGGHTAI